MATYILKKEEILNHIDIVSSDWQYHASEKDVHAMETECWRRIENLPETELITGYIAKILKDKWADTKDGYDIQNRTTLDKICDDVAREYFKTNDMEYAYSGCTLDCIVDDSYFEEV